MDLIDKRGQHKMKLIDKREMHKTHWIERQKMLKNQNGIQRIGFKKHQKQILFKTVVDFAKQII
jgi:hypothetical protein